MSKSNEKGAQFSSGSSFSSRFKMAIAHHISECKSGLAEIGRSPLSSLMTIAVLAISLALPAGFHVFLKNAQTVSTGWDNATQISLYLTADSGAAETQQLADELQRSEKVASVTIIDRDQGLNEFAELSGFGDALAYLDDNPLPNTIEITPTSQFSTPDESAQLVSELQALPQVDKAQLDLQWVRKLYGMMAIAERAINALAALLGLAVLLVVGNTIRLAIQNRREEIQIIKLVGATDAFIRRPFLYSGLWYGVFAGLFAWLLIQASIIWLKQPVQNLAGLYQSDFQLAGLAAIEVVQLIGAAAALGLVGSWLSVGRHLKDIEPT